MTLRTHRCLWVCSLAAALLALGACEDNGLLFSAVRANGPAPLAGEAIPGARAEGAAPIEVLPDAPEMDPAAASPSPPIDGPAKYGTDPASDAGVPSTAGGPGSGGVVEELPANDDSCGRTCVRRGGRCFEGTCHFDCEAPGSCSDEQIICPTGRPCEVHCGAGACVQNVICSPGADCNIQCEGAGSCDHQVICEGNCQVTCSGRDSCRSGIGGSVERLDLECSGARSCAATVSCEGGECRLLCSGWQSCGRIRTLAVDNTVSCTGFGSCAGEFQCLGATCDVECAGNACAMGVDCRALSCDL